MNLSVAQLVLRGKTIYYGQDNELEVLDGQRFLHRRGRFRDSGLGCSAPVAARARTPPPFGGIQSHPTSPSRSSATAIGTGMLTATLQKGSYELWCSVPGHKNKGMDLTIKVG